MANYTVENTKFINVEGTDALLQVLRVRKRKSDVTLTKIIPISKSELLYTPLYTKWLNGAVLSAAVSLWVMMSGVFALPFIPVIFILGVPLFSTLLEHLENWMTKPVDYMQGGREEDKNIYQDPQAMPVFELSENYFNYSDNKIIDAYNEKYEEFLKNNPEYQTLSSVSSQEQGAEELNIEYIKNRSFTEVFYGNDSDNTVEQEQNYDNTEAKQKLLEELNNSSANAEETIAITDKRTFKNSGYYQQ